MKDKFLHKNEPILPCGYIIYQDSRSFQKPSILYISGGSLASSSYLETLTDWRHKQGYVVNVASTSETDSSTTSINNGITLLIVDFEHIEEVIILVCF